MIAAKAIRTAPSRNPGNPVKFGTKDLLNRRNLVGRRLVAVRHIDALSRGVVGSLPKCVNHPGAPAPGVQSLAAAFATQTEPLGMASRTREYLCR